MTVTRRKGSKGSGNTRGLRRMANVLIELGVTTGAHPGVHREAEPKCGMLWLVGRSLRREDCSIWFLTLL